MIKRLLTPAMLLGLGMALGSCGSVAGTVADHWPHWAGGMPNDVPPRPGAPGYEEFIAHEQAKTNSAAPAATAEKTEAQTSPAGNRPPNDQAAAQGGLY